MKRRYLASRLGRRGLVIKSPLGLRSKTSQAPVNSGIRVLLRRKRLVEPTLQDSVTSDRDPKIARLLTDAKLPDSPEKVVNQPNPPLPALEGDAIVAPIVEVLASKLSAGSNTSRLKSFQAVRKPEITLDAYLRRLRRHFGCDDSCAIAAMIYIDRIISSSTEYVVNDLSIHRFLAASLLVSVKFHDDTYYTNAYYSYGVGVSLRELNVLEADFLKEIRWKLDVSPEEYFQFQQRLALTAQDVAKNELR